LPSPRVSGRSGLVGASSWVLLFGVCRNELGIDSFFFSLSVVHFNFYSLLVFSPVWLEFCQVFLSLRSCDSRDLFISILPRVPQAREAHIDGKEKILLLLPSRYFLCVSMRIRTCHVRLFEFISWRSRRAADCCEGSDLIYDRPELDLMTF
jgi:hypothetical protein